MDLNIYQTMAVTTLNPRLNSSEAILSCVLGLVGESGEIADLIKKINYHREHNTLTSEDLDKLISELGDVLWYVAALSHSLGLSLDSVANSNIEKLYRRHQGSFKPVYNSDSGDSNAKL